MPLLKLGWLDRVLNVVSVMSAISLIVMMLVTVADVVLANLFHHPIVGAFDLVVTALVFAVFLGIPVTFHREGNIVVDVVDHLVAKKTVNRLRLLARLLSLLFLLILLYNMVDPAMDSYRYGEKKPELGLPLFVIWIPIMLGVGLAIWSVVDSVIRSKRRHDGSGK